MLSPMTELFLIRHCQATGQHPDAELTSEGKEQAQALAEFLGELGIQRIISSSFRRAVESAAPLAERLGVQIELEPLLTERELGTVPGTDWMSALESSFDNLDLCFPGGESATAAMNRGRAVVDRVLSGKSLPVAVCTHGNLLALLARSFDSSLGFEFWKNLSNPDVFALSRTGDTFRIERLWR